MILASFAISLVLQSDGGATPPSDEWDLLRIAEHEAERSMAQLRDRVLELLARSVEQSEDGLEAARELAAMGPDAVPVYQRVLPQLARTSPSQAGRAAEFLVEAYKASKQSSILDGLEAAMEEPRQRRAILFGLRRLDHPRALALAQPALADDDSRTVGEAIEVLAAQTSGTASGFLRPMLVSHPSHQPQLIGALTRLKDAQARPEIETLVRESPDVDVTRAGVAYLARVGEPSSLDALERVLLSPADGWTPPLPSRIRVQALRAVRDLGLADDSARNAAERVLVKAWEEHEGSTLADNAQWELGHFRNEQAFRAYEKKYPRAARAKLSVLIEWAFVLAQFHRWDDVNKTVGKIRVKDGQGVYASEMATLNCIAYCGKENYSAAEKALKAVPGNYASLPATYPVVRLMADKDKYRYLFEPPR